MSNLITLNNQFLFNLPVDFVPETHEERYLKLLGSKRKLFATVKDYIDSNIQSITFPNISFPTVSNPQLLKRKQIKYKTVGNLYDLFDDTITVTFLNVDSNINYIIMLDLLKTHYFNVDKPYDSSIMITVLDENRSGLYNIQYRDVMWTGLSDNMFAFNDATVQQKTFTATFTYNFIDFEYVADKIDIISDNSYGTSEN
jgi:hypothetical protein